VESLLLAQSHTSMSIFSTFISGNQFDPCYGIILFSRHGVIEIAFNATIEISLRVQRLPLSSYIDLTANPKIGAHMTVHLVTV